MNALRRSARTSITTLTLASAIGCAEGVDPTSNTAPGAGGAGTGGFTATGGLTSGTGGVPAGTGATTPGTGGGLTTGGTSGTSGAGGMNPSTGGGTGTGGQQTIDAGPPAVGVIVAQYQLPSGENPTDGNIVAHIRLENRSTRAIPVSVLTIRYWYTIDGVAPATSDYQVTDLNYADIARISGGKASVKFSFGKMANPETGADHYVEIGFNGDYTLAPGTAMHAQQSSTNQIEARTHWKDYSQNYNEADDYSRDPSKASWADWDKVTVYQSGVLVWGTEPDGTKPVVPAEGGTDGGSDGATDGASPPADAGRG
jgi:hypothetical protein